jgi:hypothetical protein
VKRSNLLFQQGRGSIEDDEHVRLTSRLTTDNIKNEKISRNSDSVEQKKKKKLKSTQTPLINSRYFLALNVYKCFVDANFYTIETFKHAEETVPS